MSDLEDFDHVFGIHGEEEFDRVYQRIQLEEQENRRNIACRRRVCIRILQHRGLLTIKQRRNHHQNRSYHRVGSDILIPGLVKGIGHLYDSTLNKGLAFTIEERQKLGIHGLLPPAVLSPDDQVELAKTAINQYETDDQKYVYLQDLQIRNERLYYRILIENMETFLPIIFSPTMKLACTQLNIVYRRPRGIYISIFDRGHCLDILNNWYEHLNNKWYIGIRKKRASNEQEAELLDEFVTAAHRRFGDKLITHFEDFNTSISVSLMEKHRHKYCVFSGDIHVPGCLILSGLISAMKNNNTKLSENRILFLCTLQHASLGTAELCIEQMMGEGLMRDDALSRIWMMDRHGLLVKGREHLKGHMKNYVKDMEPMDDLLEVIKKVQPTMLIGLSRKQDAFTPDVLSEMAKLNDRPIIFAMGNPCGKPECNIENAFKHTEGRVLFACNEMIGSVTVDEKTYHIANANNAMIFPGLVLGAMLCGIQIITDDILVHVASTLSDFLTYSEIDEGKLYPPIRGLPDYANKIAEVVIRKGYEK
ncbi:hypothetical protein L9F63_019621, partial [Diploptera punctata]